LKLTFELLRQHSLFAKLIKYSFGVQEAKYLGHITSKKGVATDPAKVVAMKDWPGPTTVK